MKPIGKTVGEVSSSVHYLRTPYIPDSSLFTGHTFHYFVPTYVGSFHRGHCSSVSAANHDELVALPSIIVWHLNAV